MLNASYIRKTFFIKYWNKTGTLFAYERYGRQYLISAKHIFSENFDVKRLYIRRNNEWEKIKVEVVGMPEQEAVDVIVFKTNKIINPSDSFLSPPPPIELGHSAETFFVGYPLGYSINGTKNNNGLPVGFIKKACVAGVIGESETRTLLLDGINNMGFSGGPVITYDINDPSNVGKQWVVGVISGYQTVKGTVYEGQQETNLYVNENTGLISCVPIDVAIRIIDANPIGLPFPSIY